MVDVAPLHERFAQVVTGHWNDSIGNSIIVSSKFLSDEVQLTAVLSPLIDHPSARDTVLTIRKEADQVWRCGNANLEWADEEQQRLVWATRDGRRSVWSRASTKGVQHHGAAFPWLLNTTWHEKGVSLDVPIDILHDGARIAAILDIRQMLGASNEPQERLTHILMDHDLHDHRRDYLIPGPESPLWHTLQVTDCQRLEIQARLHKVPLEALSQHVAWNGPNEILIGHHKVAARTRDIQALEARWALDPNDPRKSLEIARLLALYSTLDNPLSNKRNGVHLGLPPELRIQCDYELFASPLNAVVPNGQFASKWPHIEWRFGSIGNYPSVLSEFPINAIVCVNPPFTEAYLSHVMSRLAELKLRFRLRLAIPIQDMPWRQKLLNSLPSAQLLKSYYDASAEQPTDISHPTLLWEDPRCPPRQTEEALAQANGGGSYNNGTTNHSVSRWEKFAAECDTAAVAGGARTKSNTPPARSMTPSARSMTPPSRPMSRPVSSATAHTNGHVPSKPTAKPEPENDEVATPKATPNDSTRQKNTSPLDDVKAEKEATPNGSTTQAFLGTETDV